MSRLLHTRAAARIRVGTLALALIGGVAACTKLPTGAATSRADTVRGITLVDWTPEGYGGLSATNALVRMRADGANTAVIVITAYQSDPRSGRVAVDPARTPSAGAVRTALMQAHAHGLHIALKPHVDLDDGAWRGTIDPQDPQAWFASYRSFILPWAALAESVGAAQFVIGTELAGTLRHEREWRDLIRALRAVYRGQLAYGASWDEVAIVPFWRDVDRVGVDFYFPVAERADAGRLELLRGWQPWLVRLERLHRQTGRPILITEIGYRSVAGAGMRPYDASGEARLDLGEQADLYWAALQAIADKPWIAGLCWWNWRADGSGGSADMDYTSDGKPAEQVLSAAWRVAP